MGGDLKREVENCSWQLSSLGIFQFRLIAMTEPDYFRCHRCRLINLKPRGGSRVFNKWVGLGWDG